jgi:putative membrane protein
MIYFIAIILTILVILLHLFFLWMEMFAWETVGRRSFGKYPREFFTSTKALAANQGLYNGFLAAGLIWSFMITDPVWAQNIRVFFLGCVTLAGIFGAVTASRIIFYIQALPAIIALIFLLASS